MVLNAIGIDDPHLCNYGLTLYLFNEIYLIGTWYLHMVCTNTNWIRTSGIKTICEIINVMGFLLKRDTSEDQTFQIGSFMGLFFVLHGLYVWQTYFFDKNKKLNFCYQYTLNQENLNLQEILDFFPESILIVKHNVKQHDEKVVFLN